MTMRMFGRRQVIAEHPHAVCAGCGALVSDPTTFERVTVTLPWNYQVERAQVGETVGEVGRRHSCGRCVTLGPRVSYTYPDGRELGLLPAHQLTRVHDLLLTVADPAGAPDDASAAAWRVVQEMAILLKVSLPEAIATASEPSAKPPRTHTAPARTTGTRSTAKKPAP
jgi:hypothetical protein